MGIRRGNASDSGDTIFYFSSINEELHVLHEVGGLSEEGAGRVYVEEDLEPIIDVNKSSGLVLSHNGEVTVTANTEIIECLIKISTLVGEFGVENIFFSDSFFAEVVDGLFEDEGRGPFVRLFHGRTIIWGVAISVDSNTIHDFILAVHN